MMKTMTLGTLMCSCAFAVVSCAAGSADSVETDPARWVDPMIGTQNGGNCFPGPSWPFGAAQPGPDTDRSPRQFNRPSGYDNRDPYLQGFSQVHVNGTGCSDLGNLRLLPFEAGTITGAVHQSADWKTSERAACGSYSADLRDLGVGVEIAAARKASIYRWTFRDGRARVLVDCRWGACGSEERLHEIISSNKVTFADSRTRMTGSICGWQWAYRKSFFALEFSRPWTSVEELPRLPRKRGGLEKAGRYVLSFDLKPGEALLAKVALLPSDEAGAAKTLAREIPGWDIEKVRRDCRAAWNDILGRAVIEGTDKQKRIWYTALYHLCLQPNDIADCDGRYRSFREPGCKYDERDVYVAKRGAFYSTFSLWDTFRAAAPFYTLLVPERVGGFLDSLLEQERHQGCLPVWPLWGSETWCMPGCHSVPEFADAYLKGIRDFDVGAAYTAITNTLKGGRWLDAKRRGHWDLIAKYGYLPFDLVKNNSVTSLLEYGYDDACAARLARALGHADDAAFFERRSYAWTNVFDKTTNLCRGRDSKGDWREPFDEFAQGWWRAKDGVDYCEANAWQYQYHAMQHPQTLIGLQGGPEAFVRRLDMYFSRKAVDAKGAVGKPLTPFGQYQHGNEPSHHVAYFYQCAGRPDRTQELVRRITDVHYDATPWGVPGNDDCGQTSAWYLFTAMGFYPFDPCGGEYVLGAPQLPRVEVKVRGEGEQRTFRVLAKGLSKENKYVKAVTLNGKPISDWKIRHDDIMKGGELVFEMSAAPGAAPIETEIGSMDALKKAVHVQGAAANEEAFYLAHYLGIEKFDWTGHRIGHSDEPNHLGDIAWHDGRLYGVFVLRGKEAQKLPGLIRVWDKDLKLIREKRFPERFDGCTVLGDTLYVGVDRFAYKPQNTCTVMMLDLDLNEKGRKTVDLGYPVICNVQTMENDGKTLFLGTYGAKPERGNPQGLCYTELTPDLALVTNGTFKCNVGFARVPKSRAAGEDGVYFTCERFYKDGPRIRLNFWRRVCGAWK